MVLSISPFTIVQITSIFIPCNELKSMILTVIYHPNTHNIIKIIRLVFLRVFLILQIRQILGLIPYELFAQSSFLTHIIFAIEVVRTFTCLANTSTRLTKLGRINKIIANRALTVPFFSSKLLDRQLVQTLVFVHVFQIKREENITKALTIDARFCISKLSQCTLQARVIISNIVTTFCAVILTFLTSSLVRIIT